MVSQRELYQVQQRIRELIKVANDTRESTVSGDTTSPQDLVAVRKLRHARQAVLDAVQLATHAGVARETIRSQGIDHTASTVIVMSDLASYMVSEVRSRL